MTHCLLLSLLLSWVCKRKLLGGITDVESDKLMLRVAPQQTSSEGSFAFKQTLLGITFPNLK